MADVDLERLRAEIERRRAVAEIARRRWPEPDDARLGYVPTRITEHIAACDPTTVIRWLGADLAIVNDHGHVGDGCCQSCDEGIGWPCPTVRQIASKYLPEGP